MEKQIVGRKTMRRGEAHLPAATDMSANTSTVTSLLHEHAGGRRRLQSRFHWDRAPKRAGDLRSHASNGKTSHTEAEAFVLSRSSSQCHLTKEQCFQWAGLTRSEHIIGPFLGLHATRLSHRPLRQGPEHLAEGPRPMRSGLSIGPSTGSIYWLNATSLPVIEKCLEQDRS
jgi:hypothetical protein